jgi:hypothetical protein
MKYIKKYENNTEDNLKKLRECKELFDEVFDEKLEFLKRNVVGLGDYNLYAIISKEMNNITFTDFNYLFSFLNNIGVEWKISEKMERMRLDVYFNDIDKFINDLKLLNNSKKYNL